MRAAEPSFFVLVLPLVLLVLAVFAEVEEFIPLREQLGAVVCVVADDQQHQNEDDDKGEDEEEDKGGDPIRGYLPLTLSLDPAYICAHER